MSETTGERTLYFGCYNGREGGHFFWGPGGRDLGYRAEQEQPWGLQVDGGLAPRPNGRWSEAPEGVAALHRKDGWTALSFWDRTGDSRGNSSSTFLFDAELDFDAALARARKVFPELFKRFTFDVVAAVSVGGGGEEK